ncbi:MupG family TIM beta-alpha barrel fold protein [Alkaliphilus serpentinus]|nr:MupG family TIM beta-alpha barrel fold protein [Alkaliphilus serpentinus]
MLGISVYAGLEVSLEKNLNLLETANDYGIKTVFTSLHIPEANERVYLELKDILKRAKELDMQVIADVSKGFINKYNLKEFDIYALRLDFGFTIHEVASYTKNYPFKIQINGSTITRDYLQQLEGLKANFNNIEVGHNYYPRRDTGLSYELFLDRNKVFKDYGLRIMAFIPSRCGKRGPIYDGLPTLECHRDMDPMITAQHLLHSGVDIVVTGDAYISEEEINRLSKIRKNVYSLPFKAFNLSEGEKRILSGIHTNRMDPGEFLIRSQEARSKKNLPIIKKNTIERKKYSITIDNEGYFRYEGELQIMKKNFEADKRVNVVGDASEAAILIDLIKPGDAFALIFDS